MSTQSLPRTPLPDCVPAELSTAIQEYWSSTDSDLSTKNTSIWDPRPLPTPELDDLVPNGWDSRPSLDSSQCSSWDDHSMLGSSRLDNEWVAAKRAEMYEFVCERCLMLDHDIGERLADSKLGRPSDSDRLRARLAQLRNQCRDLVVHFPELRNELNSRLELVCCRLSTLEQHQRRGSSLSSSGRGTAHTSSGEDLVTHGDSPNTSLSTLDVGAQQARTWLSGVDQQLTSIEHRPYNEASADEVQDMLLELQQLQASIETDGRLLVGSLAKQNSPSDRRRTVVNSLENRWHAAWLRALEWKLRLEQQLELIHSGLIEVYLDSDSDEPQQKRLRSSTPQADCLVPAASDSNVSHISDTLPFHASEYETIDTEEQWPEDMVDGNGNMEMVPARSSTPLADVQYSNAKGQAVVDRSFMVGEAGDAVAELKADGPWSLDTVHIVTQDMGYSSENSLPASSNDEAESGGRSPMKRSDAMQNLCGPSDVLETIVEAVPGAEATCSANSSPCLERRLRIEESPTKAFYRMTVDIGSDIEASPRMKRDISEDALYVYSTAGGSTTEHASGAGEDLCDIRADEISGSEMPRAAMTDSLTVNIDSTDVSPQKDLEEVLELLNESSLNGDDRFEADLLELATMGIGTGTTWKPFKAPLRRRSSCASHVTVKDAPQTSSDEACEASGEQTEEEDHVPMVEESSDKMDDSVVGDANLDETLTALCTSTPAAFRGKRRRRRRTVTTLLDGVPPSISESALMSMSLRSSSIAPSETSMSLSMTSESAAIRLGATLPLDNPMCPTPRRQALRARRTRHRRLPRSMSDGEHLSLWLRDGLAQHGLGVPLSSTSDLLSAAARAPPSPIPHFPQPEERLTSDSDDLATARPSGAGDQSEASPYEWDDYKRLPNQRIAVILMRKPPNHDESGAALEQPLDCSALHFGDDYQNYLSMLSALPQGSQARRKTAVDSESDSDIETSLRQVIHESQHQLRLARSALSSLKCSEVATTLLGTAERNLKCLRAIAAQLGRVSARDALYLDVQDLIEQWDSLTLDTRDRRALLSMDDASSSSSDELSAELSHMKESLGDLVERGKLNTSFSTGCYNSEQDVRDAIDMFRELRERLSDERARLEQLLQANRANRAKGDVVSLIRDCEVAITSCDSQLKALSSLQVSWSEWQATAASLRDYISSLENKLNAISETVHSNQDSKFFKAIEDLRLELSECVRRVSALEQLTADLESSTSCPADLSAAKDAITASLVDLHNKAHRVLPDLVPDVCDQLAPSTPEPEIRKRAAKREKALTDIIDIRTDSKPSTPVASLSPAAPRTRQQSSFGRVLRYLFSSWPVNLCVLAMLCLGALLLSPLTIRPLVVSPKLDYVDGPPPT